MKNSFDFSDFEWIEIEWMNFFTFLHEFGCEACPNSSSISAELIRKPSMPCLNSSSILEVSTENCYYNLFLRQHGASAIWTISARMTELIRLPQHSSLPSIEWIDQIAPAIWPSSLNIRARTNVAEVLEWRRIELATFFLIFLYWLCALCYTHRARRGRTYLNFSVFINFLTAAKILLYKYL